MVSCWRLCEDRLLERECGREDALTAVTLLLAEAIGSAGKLSVGMRLVDEGPVEVRRNTRSKKEDDRGEDEMVISGGA